MSTSPLITAFDWGTVTVEGLGTFRDVQLWPGAAQEWDWAGTGTRHDPGIQLEDVREIVDSDAECVVLTLGVEGVLQVRPRTVRALEQHGLQVHVARTPAAVELYNTLAATRLVGLVLHSTC
ncbi:hypothetical protein BH11ACT8_BH11ACT8_14270 [soil metagenome]